LEVSKVGKRGTIVVPAVLRRKFGIEEGKLIVAEERPDGILIRPAVAMPVEIYSPERRAEFLLSNAVDAADYKAAVAAVKKMGLDAKRVPHHRPRKRARQSI
jgi:AbrB family looped-hinge helix DNA binding protein